MAPGGFTFNQFLIDAEEPLLYHTGMRSLFPLVREAVHRVRPVEHLRWIGFAHVEADECGAVNDFLGVAPHAQVAHGTLGCQLSLNDLCHRPPRALAEGEVLDLGGAGLQRRIVEVPTPHVPHNCERLADLGPRTLAVMHGAWDVRALASHLLGMAEMSASLREQVRQMRKAGRAGGVFIDALTALQVAERETMTPQQIVERFTEVGPRAARGRRRAPGFVRRRAMPDAQPVGGKPDSPAERWTFGFLVDVILTRDPWMHRTDIAAATGAPLALTAEHDGVLWTTSCGSGPPGTGSPTASR